MSSKKESILFIATPNESSSILKSPEFSSKFNIINYTLNTIDNFLEFLKNHNGDNIVAIYGGYPAFSPIGGLTRSLLEHPHFPKHTLKCIVLCSRGYNGIDLEALKDHGIKLFNYQDDEIDENTIVKDFKKGLVGNDVADCVMWHLLEGFRKFSYQQRVTRESKDTLTARSNTCGKPGYAFGHELGQMINRNSTLYTESPRGKKCLILGLGSIGKQIAYKIDHGLGMEVHYSKRTEDIEITQMYPNWTYHPFNDTLLEKLDMFHSIVISLPGTPETHHLINEKFLSHCKAGELILVNIGRGNILELSAVKNAINEGIIRHLGVDVFYNEPTIDNDILIDDRLTTITPHIGSSTKDVFSQSCDNALSNIFNISLDQNFTSYSRIV
ncbi:hypothetical protein Kpol_541p52 [Vanderwaltozyma polyspora DSM 70294]|uniref:D-isomer specific 2-hydroxyacid dehydrogenase NAD-binding domain-containing protein n=1 Tax=Vanderwaltozyma polyspora (strain ATCC 22028 / DSM 70294 / BCRC 21397 / CBS 2163 / NBRC 10782 / NRRL Y-8283 / UCD 57-17) TaxID=436907 RepID=A7TIZ7_VANPO|nr:uncharacterized protein Kpol_541p52 [Vanderwaltozyma polyspora DSM 70294]EDO17809.1 hypothetical protein Kpol_541p52 [Vanderwaltozyma polyspora DSM 70294]